MVEFDPARGREIKKTRPGVIVQNDVGNRHNSLTIVAAISSRLPFRPYPIEVLVQPTTGNGLSVPSSINLSQIRSVDRERLLKRLGVFEADVMRKVDQALKVSLGLIDL
jgi:mRNA interferase MazF